MLQRQTGRIPFHSETVVRLCTELDVCIRLGYDDAAFSSCCLGNYRH